jgi:hypothetical protein
MKQVCLVISKIEEDLQSFDSSDPDTYETLITLKGNCNSTLNNLLIAVKNHATSFGMSPVSLLDAAASHLSGVIIEMVGIAKVRKATKEEVENIANGKWGEIDEVSSVSSNGLINGSGRREEREDGKGPILRQLKTQPQPLRLENMRKNESHGRFGSDGSVGEKVSPTGSNGSNGSDSGKSAGQTQNGSGIRPLITMGLGSKTTGGGNVTNGTNGRSNGIGRLPYGSNNNTFGRNNKSVDEPRLVPSQVQTPPTISSPSNHISPPNSETIGLPVGGRKRSGSFLPNGPRYVPPPVAVDTPQGSPLLSPGRMDDAPISPSRGGFGSIQMEEMDRPQQSTPEIGELKVRGFRM